MKSKRQMKRLNICRFEHLKFNLSTYHMCIRTYEFVGSLHKNYLIIEYNLQKLPTTHIHLLG